MESDASENHVKFGTVELSKNTEDSGFPVKLGTTERDNIVNSEKI